MKAAITRQEIKKMERTAESGKWVGLIKLGDGFAASVKAQSADESGWCKVRDAIVLPALIEGGLWLVEAVLKKTIEKTTSISAS